MIKIWVDTMRIITRMEQVFSSISIFPLCCNYWWFILTINTQNPARCLLKNLKVLGDLFFPSINRKRLRKENFIPVVCLLRSGFVLMSRSKWFSFGGLTSVLDLTCYWYHRLLLKHYSYPHLFVTMNSKQTSINVNGSFGFWGSDSIKKNLLFLHTSSNVIVLDSAMSEKTKKNLGYLQEATRPNSLSIL